MSVIDFAGDGAKDVTMNNGNPPPSASKGGKTVIDFAGKGASDVDYNNISTNSASRANSIRCKRCPSNFTKNFYIILQSNIIP